MHSFVKKALPPVILYFAIPVFVILLLLEAWYAYKEQKHLYDAADCFTSLAMGIGNVLIGLFTKTVIWACFSFIYKHRLIELNNNNGWFWPLLFLADDFSYYWFHRISHSVNYFWASHVVHHSSKHYNLSTALRQTWTGNISGAFLFWAWMPLLGFNPIWVLFMQQVSLIYQFWIHTETIQLLPKPVEFIFNTPSHHRVHHGSDIDYLDKNHGGILIIWDRLFNTFQPEISRPHYGLTTNIDSNNPVKIAFFTWGQLFKKAFRTHSLIQAFNYFIQPPGWNPNGQSSTTAQLRKNNKK